MRHLSQQEQIQDRKIPLGLKLQFHMMSQSLLLSISAIHVMWLLFIYRDAVEPLEYQFSLKCKCHGSSRFCIQSALAPVGASPFLPTETKPLAFPCPGKYQAAVLSVPTVIISRSNQFHAIAFSNLAQLNLTGGNNE